MYSIDHHISTLYGNESTKDTKILFGYPNKSDVFKRTIHITILIRVEYFRTIYVDLWNFTVQKITENGKTMNLINVQLEHGMKENAIDMFIMLVYGIVPNNIGSECIDVYDICDFFGFESGMEFCKGIMINNICVDNVTKFLLFAMEIQFEQLKVNCIQYLKAFAIRCISYEDAFKIPLDILLKIITDGDTVMEKKDKLDVLQKLKEVNTEKSLIDRICAYIQWNSAEVSFKTLFVFCLDKELISQIEGKTKETKQIQIGNMLITGQIRYSTKTQPSFFLTIRHGENYLTVSSKENATHHLDTYIITKTETIRYSGYMELTTFDKSLGPYIIDPSYAIEDNGHNQLPIIIELKEINCSKYDIGSS